ncbi:MAG: aminotransferase class IV [Planctomycetota bacterium]|jgi:branched-subunit amino acid aminotransferase/4-amino-4-deoxychorismate lyase
MRPLPFTTLRIEGGEPWFWDEHVERLRETAAALAIPVPTPQALYAALPRAVGGSLKVRITVAADGTPSAEAEPFEQPDEAWTLKPVPVDTDRDVVRFKTTARMIYDAAREAAASQDDALLVHHDGQVLETTVANVFFEIGNEIVTPPETRPLLPGIARRRILDGCEAATERDLDEDEARAATACCVSNAVIGVHPVEAVEGWGTFDSAGLARQLKDALRIHP